MFALTVEYGDTARTARYDTYSDAVTAAREIVPEIGVTAWDGVITAVSVRVLPRH
jgi:hypothetical protein